MSKYNNQYISIFTLIMMVTMVVLPVGIALAKNTEQGENISGIWPASGPITSPFGWRTHPIFGNKRLHTGIDIGAAYGDQAIASDSGMVITAGWINGYGNTIIIEHDNTYSTLYGHNSELLVKEGQAVQKGQVIAKVGDTGYTTGPVLHFEVRVNGSPSNPLGFLP